jgi:beta-glucosidase-like glycosyl hydrolase
MSAKIAEDCHRMGINWDFAPVVDVNTNPNNLLSETEASVLK